MHSETKWRLLSTIVLLAFSVICLAVFGLNLCLDLQCVTHFILCVDIEKVKQSE